MTDSASTASTVRAVHSNAASFYLLGTGRSGQDKGPVVRVLKRDRHFVTTINICPLCFAVISNLGIMHVTKSLITVRSNVVGVNDIVVLCDLVSSVPPCMDCVVLHPSSETASRSDGPRSVHAARQWQRRLRQLTLNDISTAGNHVLGLNSTQHGANLLVVRLRVCSVTPRRKEVAWPLVMAVLNTSCQLLDSAIQLTVGRRQPQEVIRLEGQHD